MRVLQKKHGEVASSLKECAKINPQGRRGKIFNDHLLLKEGGNVPRTSMPQILISYSPVIASISRHVISAQHIQVEMQLFSIMRRNVFNN